VTEPLADGGKVDACLEQMDRCGVAQRMRMDPFACQCEGHGGAGRNVLLQEISSASTATSLPPKKFFGYARKVTGVTPDWANTAYNSKRD